jgi:hypothetical protein
VVALLKPGNPKFPQNLHPICLLPSMGKVFEKIILDIVQKHIAGRNLLNANQFGFCTCHSTTLQCTRLMDYVTLNFNNKMSTAAVFLNIEKAFDTMWHPGSLYQLPNLKFSARLIKLITPFFHNEYSVLVEGEMTMTRYMKAGSVLSHTVYNLYIHDSPPPPKKNSMV